MPRRLGVHQVSKVMDKERNQTHTLVTNSPMKPAPKVFWRFTAAEAVMSIQWAVRLTLLRGYSI